MNKKVKALIGSTLAIAMSTSIATAGTFALFTDKAEVNVAITAGTVDVNAKIDTLKLYSMDTYMGDGVLTFENEGMARISTEKNLLELINISPGDKVEFNLEMSNDSNIAIKYRTVLEGIVLDENGDPFTGGVNLMDVLKISINTEGTILNNGKFISPWKTLSPSDTTNPIIAINPVVIELPVDVGNSYQGLKLLINYYIEAVQANADVSDPTDDETMVSTSAELSSALSAVTNGEANSVTLMGSVNGDTEVAPWADAPNLTCEYSAYNIDTLSGGEIIVDEERAFGVHLGNPKLVEDITVTGNSESVLYVQSYGRAGELNNVKVNATGGTGIYVEHSTKGVTINNATVIQSGLNSEYEVWFENALAAANGSQVVVNGGYYKSSLNAVSTFGSQYQGLDSVITINGGTFIGNIHVGGSDKVIVNGGTFSVNPATVEGIEVNGVVTKDDGMYTVYSSPKAAMTVQKKNIVLELFEDTVLDVSAWDGSANSYAVGGGIIETITVNGNGHTLTFNNKNSDWNNIATNGAKLIINNAHITNSGYNNGPWNRHDINFACDVELNNVTSDKALAFKTDATLNNVTINDANTSATYAIWIQPNGQTVNIDGLTIDMINCSDGRGIKIDEQYVIETQQKVTLNVSNAVFKTEKKSAILVKCTVGADITISNIDISGVVADSTNAVWVDEASADYADLIVVNGANKIQEPKN